MGGNDGVIGEDLVYVCVLIKWRTVLDRVSCDLGWVRGW